MRRLLPLVLFLFPSAPSQAASFDCGKAARPAEKLICADAELGRLDSRLAAAYTARLRLLSEPAKTELRRGQREWLAFWPLRCGDVKGRLPAADAEVVACAREQYGQRLAVLASRDRILGDIPLYPASQYAIQPSQAGVDWIRFATDVRQRPAVDVAAAPAQKRNLARLLERWLADGMPTEPGTGEGQDSSDGETGRAFIDSLPFLLSTGTTTYFYGHGAAHPVSGFSSAHFFLPEARPMRSADIFRDGSAWQDGLARLAEKALRRELADSYYLERFDELKALTVEPARWRFDKQGLNLQFNPYEVAPYAAGAPEVTLPWNALAPWLTPRARETVLPKK